MTRILKHNEIYIFLVVLSLSFLIQIRSGQFYTANNLVDIMSAMVVPGIFAVGAFLVILSGGIDVSFPALASLAAYATTKVFLSNGYEGGILLPLLMVMAIGAILGAINGYFVGYLRLPALIVTLGTASLFKGFMQGTLQSKQLAVIPVGMKTFGVDSLFIATNPVSGLTSRLPMSFLIFIAVLAVVFLMLKYTMFGRSIYAIGGNESAAYNASFNVKKNKFILYIIVGILASIAGLVRFSMMQQAHPTNMLGMELNIIAGVVLGGTAIVGGKGTLTGCILGTLLVVIVENSMILIGVPVVWKNVFVGLLIVIGTAVSAYQVYRSGISKGHFKKLGG